MWRFQFRSFFISLVPIQWIGISFQYQNISMHRKYFPGLNLTLFRNPDVTERSRSLHTCIPHFSRHERLVLVSSMWFMCIVEAAPFQITLSSGQGEKKWNMVQIYRAAGVASLPDCHFVLWMNFITCPIKSEETQSALTPLFQTGNPTEWIIESSAPIWTGLVDSVEM